MENGILNAIKNANTIGIGGHVRPDGDCVGSVMGLYRYIISNYQDKSVSFYLEEIPHSLAFLSEGIVSESSHEELDLFFALDCGDEDRLGDAKEIMLKSKYVINMDHHVTNTRFGAENYVDPHASSTCQVLYEYLDESAISLEVATALYTGIIHDTGVFKHSNTSKRTMEIAGQLISLGVPFGKIIDESFFQKNYRQLQIWGRCLLSSIRVLQNQCIFAVVTKRILEFYEATPADLDGVIDQMRTTEGIEVAILLTEKELGTYKVSMRSNEKVNVAEICSFFGGGGHDKAAGCTIEGSSHDVINNLTAHIEKQL